MFSHNRFIITIAEGGGGDPGVKNLTTEGTRLHRGITQRKASVVILFLVFVFSV